MPGVTIRFMDIALLFSLLALAVGGLAGWLLGSRQAEAHARRREQLLLRNADLAGLLHPVRESLAQVGRQLAEVERGRASSDAALREQVDAMARSSQYLSEQGRQLANALRAPQVRGRWGEMQLQRVVEAAGLTEHVDYDTQVTVVGDDGTVRPDLVVRLTGGKNVVVDAKAACSAYLEAAEAPDEPTRDARLKAHARQLRTHVDALAAKTYWERLRPAPEFVVCFVPADAFLDAALREDPTLLEHAFSRNVVLATPTTLVALLRTIAYGWRQEALAANAQQVHDLGRDLYRRLATLGGHFERLGRSLGTAVGAYNDAIGSLERMVMPKARQLSDLGVGDPATGPRPLEPLTTATPRPLTAVEFG